MPKKRVEVRFEALSDKAKGTVIVEVPSYNVPVAPRVKLRRPVIRPVFVKPQIEKQPIPTIVEVPYVPEETIEKTIPVNAIPEEYDTGTPTDKSDTLP